MKRKAQRPDPHKTQSSGTTVGPRDGYEADETEFIMAVERFKRERRKPFPSSRDLLNIAKALGYRRVAPAQPTPPEASR